MDKFVIQGPQNLLSDTEIDPDEYLYWSNEIGWVDFASATRFEAHEVDMDMPIEFNGIVWLDNNAFGFVESIHDARKRIWGLTKH